MSWSLERALGTVAARLVDSAQARPRRTLVVGVLATLVAGGLAVTNLRVDTDADRLLSDDIPVRRANLQLARAFPDLQNNLVVMIEADRSSDARAAARALKAALGARPDRYPGIFLPGDSDFYDEFGLFYVDEERLDELATEVERAGPLLAALAQRPELSLLALALSKAIEGTEGLDGLGEQGLRVLEDVARVVEAFNDGRSESVDWEVIVDSGSLDEYEGPQLLMVRPAGDLTQMAPVAAAIADIRRLAGELEPRPGLRVRVTGDRAVHTEEMSLVIEEAAFFGVASLILVVLILLYVLRSRRLLIATVITLLIGLVWTAGFAALTVGRLNVLTTAFAVLYIGLGVDFGIHFALGYLESRGRGLSPMRSLHETGATTGSSLLSCALTTAIGFYAFIPTDYSGVAEMGIISGSGVLLGLIATLTLYPSLISLGLDGSGAGSARLPRGKRLIRLPLFPLRYPRAVCATTLCVVIASCGALQFVRFDINPLNVRDPRVESVQALKDLLALDDLSVWTIEILAKDATEAATIARDLESLDGIEHVNTIHSFVPSDQAARLETFDAMRSNLTTPIEDTLDRPDEIDAESMLDISIEEYGVALDIDADFRGEDAEEAPALRVAERLREALDRLQARRVDAEDTTDLAPLERNLFGGLPDVIDGLIDALPERTVTIADLPPDLTSRYVAGDGRARVEVFSAYDLNAPGGLERFSDLVAGLRPDLGGPAAGTVALGRAIVGSLRQALVTAIVLIGLFLLAISRSLKYTLITLTPLCIGALATAALAVAAGISFNFANVIVLPLILGIGVDSGIHLVHRHRAGLRNSQNLLTTSTANAILYSALTTILSFSTLAFSAHLGISSLAQLLSAGVVLMLVSNVVVLPALLTLIEGKR